MGQNSSYLNICDGTKYALKVFKHLKVAIFLYVKFGRSEKGKKFEKIFHLKFDATEQRQILSGRFFQILSLSQNVQTLLERARYAIWNSKLQTAK